MQLLKWDPDITSTTDDSVVCSKVFRACFVHSRRQVSRNSSGNIPELTASWYSIWWTVRTSAFGDHGGLVLLKAMNWSRCCLRNPAEGYIPRWSSSPPIWIDSHLRSCCFLFLRLPVLLIFFKLASRIILSVAAIAAWRWTNWWLRYCWFWLSGGLLEASVVRLHFAPIAPIGSVSGAMACSWRNMRKMITKRSGKCCRLYSELQFKMEWVTAKLHFQLKLNPAEYIYSAYSCQGYQRSCNSSKSV